MVDFSTKCDAVNEMVLDGEKYTRFIWYPKTEKEQHNLWIFLNNNGVDGMDIYEANYWSINNQYVRCTYCYDRSIYE